MGINNEQLIDKIFNQTLNIYPIDSGTALKLAKYVEILLKWNKVYSLTAITNIDEIIRLHVIDGLSIMNHLCGIKRIIDVGSGMGVPGVLIAIVNPDIEVCLIDINSKKTSFLKQASIELGLKNVEVITSKVEDYNTSNKFDAAISRAFTSSNMFIELTKHLLKENTSQWLLMKSAKINDEVSLIANHNYDIIDLMMNNLIGERYLLKIYNK